ncbi:MAG TPA: EAL domain-containing protein [Pseudolabrys sp.]
MANALTVLDGHRRDKLLETVAIAAKELLRSTDLAVSLPIVIELFGHAIGVDRAHIFLIDTASGPKNVLQHSVWTAPGIATPPEFQNSKEPMTNVGLRSWVPRLERGETISAHVREFGSKRRAFFNLGGVKSILVVPIFADGRWSGVIGVDECHTERDWSTAEIDAIKTVAELVGAGMVRTAQLKALADANRIIENSPTILYRTAPEFPFPVTYMSENISQYGYNADEFLSTPGRWVQMIDSSDLPIVLDGIRSMSEGRDSAHAEFRLKKPDGSTKWVDGRGTAVRDADGRLVAIEGLVTDITDRKNFERDLSFSKILLTTAIESSPDAILIVDTNNHIVMFNRHFVELWEIPQALVDARADEPVLRTVAARMKNQSEFKAHVRYLYDNPEIKNHEELELLDGRIVERHSGSLYDEQKKYLGRIWFFRDITEKRRDMDKIAAMARTDLLTGLSNRAAFLDRLNLEFARASRNGSHFAVHYLDLDHFKDVNDTLGHPVGDQLLRAVADRLKTCVRESDMVARFGGDEFAVLQDNAGDITSIEALAVKIGEAVSGTYTIAGNVVSTTVSIGIVPYRSDIAGADIMMMKADLALYRAKNGGRNKFSLHVAELDELTRERMMIGEDLRHAIDNRELELVYQPQVEIESGRIVGLEALLRWNHATRGLMLPGTFIPIAETTGSIVPIGEWVIEQACRQIRVWNDLGIAPSIVAVNLSGAQFKLSPDLDRVVAKNLARFNVPPSQLELELTETVLMETTQKHSEALDRLRKIGVRITIDDFGTGYSSLDYLRSFHVSRLKIDRRFICDVTTDPDDATIVRATVSLAHALGIEVVAEGVETAKQKSFLISAGCRLAQGYYFGKPMPAATASERLRENLHLAPA